MRVNEKGREREKEREGKEREFFDFDMKDPFHIFFYKLQNTTKKHIKS